jgi:integrase/recombinase XerD
MVEGGDTWPQSFNGHRDSFIESLRVRSYSPATCQARREALSVFFRFLAVNNVEDLRAVNRETIRAYASSLMAEASSIWTVHQRLMGVRGFFEHLEKTDAVLLNPCEGLRLPKLGDRLPRAVLTKSEARTVLDAPDTCTKQGIRDRAILEVFYSTGIRLEEMARLTIHDVDTRNGFLRVNQGKFAKDRVVPLGGKACDYVREYLTKVRAEWARKNRDERALWLSSIQPHGPLKSQRIEQMVREYGRQAGITRNVSPHVWRHTCATHLVSSGANIAYVQRLLGHRSLETTQRYSRAAAAEVKATHRKAHPRQKTKAQ